MLGEGLQQFPRVQALVCFEVDKEQTWSLGKSRGSLQAWLTARRNLASARAWGPPFLPT